MLREPIGDGKRKDMRHRKKGNIEKAGKERLCRAL